MSLSVSVRAASLTPARSYVYLSGSPGYRRVL